MAITEKKFVNGQWIEVEVEKPTETQSEEQEAFEEVSDTEAEADTEEQQEAETKEEASPLPKKAETSSPKIKEERLYPFITKYEKSKKIKRQINIDENTMKKIDAITKEYSSIIQTHHIVNYLLEQVEKVFGPAKNMSDKEKE